MNRSRLPWVALTAAFLFWAGTVAAAESGFGVAPVRIDLSAADARGIFTLSNPGDFPITVQAQPREWVQEHGRDVYRPTDAFIVNPAIVTIEPGKNRIVRIAMRPGHESSSERAFRMLFTELLPATGASTTGASTLQVVRRMDVAVWVLPSGDKRAPKGSISGSTDGRSARLRFTNEGDGHWRLSDLAVLDPAGTRLIPSQLLIVLPHSSRDIELPLRGGDTPAVIDVKATSQGEPFEARVSMERPR